MHRTYFPGFRRLGRSRRKNPGCVCGPRATSPGKSYRRQARAATAKGARHGAGPLHGWAEQFAQDAQRYTCGDAYREQRRGRLSAVRILFEFSKTFAKNLRLHRLHRELRASASNRPLLAVSVAAGVPLRVLSKLSPPVQWARAMPSPFAVAAAA